MLSLADADLIKRDDRLPGLATLLDADAFADAWRAQAAATDIESAELTYLRYKPATNCVASYRIRSAREIRTVYAKAYGADAATKLRKAQGRSSGVVCADLGIAAFAFPEDVKLRTLSRLALPARRRALFARIFRGSEGRRDGALHTLGYKPERRYVARFEPEIGADALLKFYAPEGFPQAARNRKAFESRGVLRIAGRCGGSKRHGVLAFEWLRGTPLRDVLADPLADVAALSKVGAALAALHAQAGSALAPRNSQLESAQLRDLAATIGFLLPPLARRAASLAERVSTRLVRAGGAHCAIHGDLYDKQVLLGSERVAILDLDQAAHGDPRSDLGLFVAHLERDHLLGQLDASRVADASGALVQGYQEATGVRVEELAAHVAGGLLRLAHHPFRNHTPGWPDHTVQILERVAEILAGPP